MAPPAAKRRPRPHPQDHKKKTAAMQADVEGAAHPAGKIEFEGETYRIADQVGVWPLMQFARAAESGIEIRDFRALAALHAFLQDCLHPDDWGRFQDNMISGKLNDPDKLLNLATTVVEMVTSRPTPQPSVSSNGQPEASDGSTGESSSPAETE